ncbi:hypothetical protein LEMLEM_LOCUS7819, partial [Lemmus lemmus]
LRDHKRWDFGAEETDPSYRKRIQPARQKRPREMLPEAYCAQESLLCAPPAGPPSRPWFPARLEFLRNTEPGHRKSRHSLGPVPGTAEADRGRAEGTGRHGGRGLRGPRH